MTLRLPLTAEDHAKQEHYEKFITEVDMLANCEECIAVYERIAEAPTPKSPAGIRLKLFMLALISTKYKQIAKENDK